LGSKNEELRYMNVKVGVIGAGYWGNKVIQEYWALSQKRKDLKLMAVADSSQQQLDGLYQKHNFPSSMLHTNYRDIIEDENINAIHIATPNETHFQIATEALERGKNVLTEKPMALSTRDAFKMVRLAEELNHVLLVGHIFRFSNALCKLKELMSDGSLGETRCITLRWSTSMSPPKDRDIIWDLAPHPVDIINYLFDEWPINVYANGESYVRNKAGLEETAFLLANLPDRKIASIYLSWIQPGPKNRDLTLVGSKATAYVDVLNQKVSLYTDSANPRIYPVVENNTIESMINHYADSIIHGDAPKNSAFVGALTVSVLESMRKSLETSNPIRIMW
jgi:predicted dehydrogenase